MRHRERLLGNLQGGAMSATGSVGKQTIRVDRRVFLSMLNNERVATPHKAMSKPVNPSRFINNFILEHIMSVNNRNVDLIVNLGLLTSLNHEYGGQYSKGQDVPLEDAIEELESYGIVVKWHRVEQSNTESTLVAGLSLPMTAQLGVMLRTIETIGTNLQQEAVAVYDPHTGEGHLVGEHAADWGGEFNPEYFILG